MENTTKTRDVLAKLLATENLSIEYRKIKTAYFDLENRTIFLPILKVGSENMYSLFTMHEVGHALFTPTNDWLQLGKVKPPEYMYFLNVVEDARIERRIQRLYPGSRHDFVNGYRTIFSDSTMFNISGINNGTLIDRLNIYAKLGMLISIRFTNEEKLIVNELNAVESWEDTINLVDKLYAEHKNAAKSPANSNSEEDTEDAAKSPTNSNSEEDAEDAAKPAGDSNSEEDAEDAEDAAKPAGPSANSNSEEDAEDVAISPGDSKPDGGRKPDGDSNSENSGENTEDTKLGETVDAIDKALYSYVDRTDASISTQTLTLTQQFPLNDFIISVEEMLKLIEEQEKKYMFGKFRYGGNSPPVARDNTMLTKFVAKNKTNLNYMISRFESKKSASNYVKSKISKSGMIDCNKLHQYSVSEDIFKRVTVLPNGKNHGLILIVDFSSSMHDGHLLRGVFAQLINILMFCRRGRIKHEVYAFSNSSMYGCKLLSAVSNKAWDSMNTGYAREGGMIKLDKQVRLLELFNDRMSQVNFDYMCTSLLRFVSYPSLRLFHMCTTPLKESLFLARKIIERFKNRTNTEIVNCVYLTDGDGDGVDKITNPLIVRDDVSAVPMKFEVGTATTSIFTKLLKLTTDVNLVNFRLIEAIYNGKLIGGNTEFSRLARYTRTSVGQLRGAFMKDLVLKIKHVMGFDEWYLIESNVLSVVAIAIANNVNSINNNKLAALNNSFLTYSKRQTAQRTILSNFIDKIC